jgi:hypothetical protein
MLCFPSLYYFLGFGPGNHKLSVDKSENIIQEVMVEDSHVDPVPMSFRGWVHQRHDFRLPKFSSHSPTHQLYHFAQQCTTGSSFTSEPQSNKGNEVLRAESLGLKHRCPVYLHSSSVKKCTGNFCPWFKMGLASGIIT